MKTKIFFLFVILISFLGINQVKADTIYISLPATEPYYSCEDVNDFNTFFVAKHPMMTSTPVWSLGGQAFPNGDDFPYCDTLKYTPTSIGNHSLICTWNNIPFSVIIKLYSAPPPSPTFAVSSNVGEISLNRDTAWMCGPSIIVSATNAFGSDAMYSEWNWLGGSTNNPVTITIPGTYYYERGNTCGVTIDSIEVISLPILAPVWTDTVFCNETVSLTLDAGPGWNYVWNTTETTQSILVETAGTYICQLTNVCTSTSASMTVEHQSYPLPDLTSFDLSMMCQDSSIVLDPGYIYDTHLWHCPNGNTKHTPTISTSFETMGSGLYDLTITQGGCTEHTQALCEYFEDPLSPMHCVSTFDPITGKNMTVFESSPFEVQYLTDYILCYKQGDDWIPIDTVAHSIGTYEYTMYDSINNANQQSVTYAVFSLHSCGNLSMLSDWHKTIRIGIFAEVGTSDYILQILDDYQTMDENYHPESYTIWIDSENNGNLIEIGVLYGNNRSYTISSPVNGAAYYASVNLPWNCGGTKSYPVALSNKKVFGTTDISLNNLNTEINIFPNPSSGIFQIEGQISSLEVFDNLGRLILSTNEKTIDLTTFGQGVYYAKIQTANGPAFAKLIVQ